MKRTSRKLSETFSLDQFKDLMKEAFLLAFYSYEQKIHMNVKNTSVFYIYGK